MLPRADIGGTRPVGRIEGATPATAPADARQETFNRLAQVAIGKQFQADILSRLNDGTFLVRVADTVARMNLPAGMRAGDSVKMTLVSADPRPTFLLENQANGPTASLNTSAQLADRFLQMAPEPGGAAAGKPAQVDADAASANPATLADPAKAAPGPMRRQKLRWPRRPQARSARRQSQRPRPNSAPRCRAARRLRSAWPVA